MQQIADKVDDAVHNKAWEIIEMTKARNPSDVFTYAAELRMSVWWESYLLLNPIDEEVSDETVIEAWLVDAYYGPHVVGNTPDPKDEDYWA
jgi:hypothetical protein